MSGIGMAMMAGAPNLVVQNIAASLWNFGASPAIRTASVTFQTDGTMTKSSTGPVSTAWYSQTITGIGSSYWVKITVNSTAGSTTTGTTSWINITSAVTWSASNTGASGEGAGNATIQIAADSAGVSVVGTGTLNWDVGYTP